MERNLLFAEMMTDHSHHYADVERVLYCGFEKIRKEIAEMQVESTDEQEFKDSMLAACDAAIALGYKFSEEADRMLQTEKDDSVREQLIRIRDTAGRVPRLPAKTFYEALTSVWFTRELCTAMEAADLQLWDTMTGFCIHITEKILKNNESQKKRLRI